MYRDEMESPLQYWTGNIIWVNKTDKSEVQGRLLDVKEDYLIIETEDGEHIYYKSERVHSITINAKDTIQYNQVQKKARPPYLDESQFTELIKRLAHRYVRINCGEEDIHGIMAGSRQNDLLVVREHEVIILFANGIHHIRCVHEETEAHGDTAKLNDAETTKKAMNSTDKATDFSEAISEEADEQKSGIEEIKEIENTEERADNPKLEMKEQAQNQSENLETETQAEAYVEREDDVTEARVVAQDADFAFEEDDEMEMEQKEGVINVSFEREEEEFEIEEETETHVATAPFAPFMQQDPELLEPEQEVTDSESTVATQPEIKSAPVLPLFPRASRTKKQTSPERASIKRTKRKDVKNRTLSSEGEVRKKKKANANRNTNANANRNTNRNTNANTNRNGKVKQAKSKAWLTEKVKGQFIS